MIAGVRDAGQRHDLWDGKLICDTVFPRAPSGARIGLMFQDFALFPTPERAIT